MSKALDQNYHAYFFDKYRGNLVRAYGDGIGYNANFFIDLYDSLSTPIYCKDLEGVYIYCNEAFARFVSMGREQIVGKSLYDIVDFTDPLLHHRKDVEVINDQALVQYESIFNIGGSERYYIFNKSPFFDGAGNVVGIVGVMSDITENRVYQRRLTRMNGLKSAMLKLSSFFLREKDQLRVTAAIVETYGSINEKVRFGYFAKMNGEQIILKNRLTTVKSDLFHSTIEFDESMYKQWVLEGGLDPQIIRHRLSDRNYAHFKLNNDMSVSAMIPIVVDEVLYGFFCFDAYDYDAFDETDLEFMMYVKNHLESYIVNNRMYNEILNISRYDKLTNIFNRRYFEEHFDVILNRAKRYKETFNLVIFDLNGLKATNDKYGHLAGDYVIKEFVDTISMSIRTSDIFARFGGDEFIGIFFDTEMNPLSEKLESLNVLLRENPVDYKGNELALSFSYGIANYPEDGDTYESLFNGADKRMYVYKYGRVKKD